jgi:AmmeMemoRadiSam system protein B
LKISKPSWWRRRGRLRNRKPAVAGQFYEADPVLLRKQIEDCFRHKIGPGGLPTPGEVAREDIVATLNPHAGYMYSGPVAAHSFKALSSVPGHGLVVIVGPNHYGIGSGVAAPLSDEWETPLGSVQIDVQAARELMRESRMVDMDDSAHWREHSIEVQIPFLQFIYSKGFKILPVSMGMQDRETAEVLGESLANLVGRRGGILIASSDFTHYEPDEYARVKDQKALDYILKFDVTGFYSYIQEVELSMCGYGPVAAIMVAAQRLGASRAEKLCYATSGDTGGNKSSVVGYASVLFLR